MEAARNAVSKFTSRSGHRTDVDEVVNPAVTSEVIKPHRHEETTEAIDRETHQHHYHTTVQPIAHQETLPEQHVHNLMPQVEREFRHDNEAETKARVERELGQFTNTSTVTETRHTASAAAAVTGEHVHHHVHETVQPVIHKETYQPEVIHTTVPIHETHHASAQHHGMSALPMKTLDEFTQAGGLIGGTKSHTHEEYEGAPRPYNEKLMTSIEKVLPTTGHHSHHHGHHHGTTGAVGGISGSSGVRDSGLGNDTVREGGALDNRYGSGNTGISSTSGNVAGLSSGNREGGSLENRYGSGNTGLSGVGGSNVSGREGGALENRFGSGNTGISSTSGNTAGLSSGNREGGSLENRYGSGETGVSSGNSSNTKSKPSLMDKLNPNVDSNGDGKAGFMK